MNMSPKRTTAVLVLGLALLVSGCAALRPPAGDREAWEAQQQQAADRQEAAMEQDPVGMSLYFAYVGYCLAEIGYALSK
jgi:PBP1b-binding outer membrane lipoprotein LpoB